MVILAIFIAILALMPPFLFLTGHIRDPFHPLIFMGVIAYFLVPHTIIFHSQEVLELGMEEDKYIQYLIVTGISLLGLYAGWNYSAKKSPAGAQAAAPPRRYDPGMMIAVACSFIAVSIPVHFIYTIKYEEGVSAYLTDFIPRLWTPASILLVQAYFLVGRNARRGILFLLALAFVPPFERFWSYGQRGDFLRIAAVLGLFYIQANKRPSKPAFIAAACVLGLIAMTLVSTRTLIRLGEAENRFAAIVKVIPAFLEGHFEPVNAGAEFVFGAAQVETVRADGHYGWGRTFTVALVGRALPRQWFPDKEKWIFFHSGNDFKNIRYATGLAIPTGSAPTGFASGFADFSWACPLVWFFFGYAFQRVWQRALDSSDIRYSGYFIGFAVAALFAMTQDLLTAEMNLIIALVPLAVVYRIARVQPSAFSSLQPA